MRSTMILAALVAILTLTTAPAMATPPTADDEPVSLQEIFDYFTEGGVSSVNAETDMMDDLLDSYWSITASGGSVATMIIEVAGNAGSNKFGVFEMSNPDNKVMIFDGPIVPGGVAGQATLAIETRVGGGFNVVVTSVYGSNFLDPGVWSTSSFGYYLEGPGGTFYSDSLLNPQFADHMLAFQGTGDLLNLTGFPGGKPWSPNEFILAWEDVSAGADWDYNDLLVMVESVVPVPVPGAVLLGVLGLGAAGMRLRKRQS